MLVAGKIPMKLGALVNHRSNEVETQMGQHYNKQLIKRQHEKRKFDSGHFVYACYRKN